MDRLGDLIQIEQTRCTRVWQKLKQEAKEEAERTLRERPRPGPHGVAIIHARARAAALTKIIDECIDIRRELALQEPRLFEEEHIKDWQESLRRVILGWEGSQIDEYTRAQRAAGAAHFKPSLFEQGTIEANGQVASAAKEFILCGKHDISTSRNPMSNGPISVSVVGSNAIVGVNSKLHDINGFVASIVQQGKPDVAKAIEQLTDAIKGSPELGEQQVPALDAVQELARAVSTDEGRTAVPTVLRYLQAVGANAANVAQILSVVGPVLANHFGFHWPV